MRNLIFAAAAFTAIGCFPAAAAGCGMMEQAAGKEATQDAPAGGMMCGAAKAESPQSMPGQSPQAAGGCPCCAKMASMKMPDAKEDSMPGMKMPATPPTPGQ